MATFTKDERYYSAISDAQQGIDDSGIERRGRERSPYPCEQLVAPLHGERLPDASQFVRVKCHDLSTGGFSYFSPALPACDQIVVAFGNATRYTFLAAHIRYAKRVVQAGSTIFQIGCQFLGRME